LKCPRQEYPDLVIQVLKVGAQRGQSRVRFSVAALGTGKHRSKYILVWRHFTNLNAHEENLAN